MSRNRDFHRNSLELISDLRFSTFCFNVNKREGGTPLYKPYRHVPPQRVQFLSRFDLKTGIDLAHVGLELRECMRKKKKEICGFEMYFNKYFLLPFLSNDDIISQLQLQLSQRPGLNSECEK